MTARRIGLLAAWLVATTASVALAYEAVDLVRDQVVERPMARGRAPAPQPAASEPAALLESLLQLEDSLSDEVPATTATTGPESTATTGPESTATTVPATAPPATDQSTTTTTVPTPQHEPPPSEHKDGGQLEEAIYELRGGWVTIRFGFGFIEFVRAVPRSGYQTHVKKTGPKQVEVEFHSEYRGSEFKAQWVHDALDVSVQEDIEDD